VRTRSFGEVSLYFARLNNWFRLVVIRESMFTGFLDFWYFWFCFGLSLAWVLKELRGRLGCGIGDVCWFFMALREDILLERAS